MQALLRRDYGTVGVYVGPGIVGPVIIVPELN